MSKSGNINKVYELAANQWGLFTSAQALNIGTSRNQINRMINDGRVEQITYGTYRVVASPESKDTATKAAWLSLNPDKSAFERLSSNRIDAVATGRTAAFLYGYGDLYQSPFSFVVPKGKRTARKDLELIQDEIAEDDISVMFDIPVATPERLIADLVRLREDPSLIGNIISDAAKTGYVFQASKLGDLLSPYAKANGFEPNDGLKFAEKLIEDNALKAGMVSAMESLKAILDQSNNYERFLEIVSSITQDIPSIMSGNAAIIPMITNAKSAASLEERNNE